MTREAVIQKTQEKRRYGNLPDNIIKRTAKFFNVNPSYILTSRSGKAVKIRRFIAVLMKEESELTLREISETLNYADHTGAGTLIKCFRTYEEYSPWENEGYKPYKTYMLAHRS